MSPRARLRRPEVLLELFIISNLAFLAVDIYVAHSMNRFRHAAEWIPFAFSIVATLALVPGTLRTLLGKARGRDTVGLVVGVASIAVGLAGLLWHLDGHFFEEQTLRNLVYSAPFLAPLAYAGLGFLLLANRMVPHGSGEWAFWVLILALGGLIGNFGLSLLDHAQNGFFETTEWIPVVVIAVGVGTVGTVAALPDDALLRRVAWGVLGLHLVTAVAGFTLHGLANLSGPGTLWERFVYGAPIFTPLLFADLALLTAIGLYALDSAGGPTPAR